MLGRILDVVAGEIACVEVLDRADVRQKLDEVFPVDRHSASAEHTLLDSTNKVAVERNGRAKNKKQED